MASNTYVSVTIANKDHEKAIDLMEGEDHFSDNDDGTTTFGLNDCDPDDVGLLEDKGIVFVGYHQSGGDFGPSVFAYDGTEFIELPSDWDTEMPVVGIREDGDLEPGHEESAMAYWKVYRNAMNIMQGRVNP